MSMNKLILIRGIPGSGKSTLAKTYKGYEHLEADMFFYHEGQYLFNPMFLSIAHKWCLDTTAKMLKAGKSVVVSNTFIRKADMEPYINLGYPIEIIEAKGNYKTVHNVPEEKIQFMKDMYEK